MENEALVHDALTAALTGRTANVIAHRLSTVRSADRSSFLTTPASPSKEPTTNLSQLTAIYKSLRAGELLTAETNAAVMRWRRPPAEAVIAISSGVLVEVALVVILGVIEHPVASCRCVKFGS